MDVFSQLGRKIEFSWREKDYDDAEFPRLAADALREAGLPDTVTPRDIIEWVLDQDVLLGQKDVAGRFADPPVTLFTAQRFYIDAYFWFEGTTAIHQHGFCGAFQVLAGSSIHSWYEFAIEKAINSFLEIGEMRLKVCELLNVGDIQKIEAGRGYIHSLFHLDYPSVTITVRTEKSPKFLPQYSYHKPSLAIDPFFTNETLTKKLQAVHALLRGDPENADELIGSLLRRTDLHVSYLILSSLHEMLCTNAIEQEFELNIGRDRFERFLSIVKERHGENGSAIDKALQFQERSMELVRRRGYVNDPEQRFLLALLMNVEGKQRILGLMQQRFPQFDPLEKILDLVYDMAQTRVLGVKTPNALGIADFGDIEILILENLLRRRTRAQISETLNESGAARFEENLDELIVKITRAEVLQPLFVDD